MSKNLTLWLVILLVVLGLGVIGYSLYKGGYKTNTNNSGNTQTVTPGEVSISSFSFNPGTETIKKGQTVTWKNNDSVAHTVVLNDGSYSSGEIAAGASVIHTFNSTGSFAYHCSIHPSMTATVVVQ